MLKPLILTASIISSISLGTILIDEIKPQAQDTVSYTSIDNLMKNALFLSNLGQENAVFISFSEQIKPIQNLIYINETVKYQTDATCYIGSLNDAQDKYIISDC